MKAISMFFPLVWRRLLPVLVSMLFLLGWQAIGNATEEVFYGSLQRQQLLATTPSFEVSDTFPSSVDQTISVRDMIWLTIDEDTIRKDTPFVHWVKVTIEKYDASNTLIGTETNVQFTVSYDPAEGARYSYGQVYEFKNVYRFKVTVTSKSTSFPAHFRLEGKIIIDRKYPFDCATAPALLTKPDSLLRDTTINALQVGWDKMAGAEEYDLEWVFYDSLSTILSIAAGSHSNFDFLFRNNATRITTSQTWYGIPLVYPAGVVYWRVRGVRYKDGEREQSQWTSLRTSSDTLVLGKELYWVKCHEKALNWQMQSIFAEEGKKSQSATYFDGSLYSRQKVVRSEAIDMVVASETIYDSLGRATIQVMPAPVSFDTFSDSWTRAIKYIGSYSKAPGKSSYGAADFNFTGDSCNVATLNPASKMDSATCAVARYYSSANPWKKNFMAKFTPASDGYPLSVTEYESDPTGRIRRQGGVGPAFQLGSGHETKYFYSKPDQEELDRLFGNEAGYAAHYQKNAVIDPNGQISVSYLDAHGRTVATALAGAKPANLDQLSNFSTAARIKKDLLNNVKDDLALRSTYSLFVSSAGPDTFTYSFQPPLQLSIDSCLSAARCYDCKYDVQISVKSECGQEMINGGAPFTWNNYSSFDLTCNTLPDTLVQTLIATLPIGIYQVTKVIRVSETALNYYADDFLAHLTCIPNPDSLKRLFLGDTICAATCAECYDRLGTWTSYLAEYTAPIEAPAAQDTLDAQNAYNSAYEACKDLCDNSDPSDCQVMYEMMLSDVSPGGQYAAYEESIVGPGPDSTFVYTASSDTTSVFHKFPGDGIYPYQDVSHLGLYYDEFGNIDYVTLPDSTPIRVDSLSINEFITYFKPSWTKTLVKAHPEYCAWLCCKNSSDPTFDSVLTSITSYSQAVAAGFLPIDSLIAHDSFFVYNPGLTGQMDTVWNYYTYTSTSQCNQPITLTEIIKSVIYCGGQLPCDVDIDTLCTADNDLFWQLMQSHYLSERNRLKWNTIRSGACMAQPDSIGHYCKHYHDLCFGQPVCGGNPNPYREKISRLFSSPAPLSLAATEDSIQIMVQYVYDQLEHACDTTCAGMAEAWIQQLSQSCDSVANADSSHLAALRTRLIAVCKSGCDFDHPFGSVTTASDSTTYGDYTLQDVLKHVFPSLDTCTSGCRTELIGFPGTYGVKQYTAPTAQIYNLDSCRCSRLDALEGCWHAVSDTTTFLEFLNSFSDVQLTEDQLDKLGLGCDTNCIFMDEAIVVPPILECNTCKTLAELKPAWNAYISSTCIGGSVSTAEEVVLAGYMNRAFGLNRTYEDYYAFIVSGPQGDSTCRYLCPLALFSPATIDTSCVSAELDEGMDALAYLTYQNLLDSMRQVFVRNYLGKCLGPELVEKFKVAVPQGEYQYALYYYDQADNLVRTVPPKGVTPLTSAADLQAVKDHRANPVNSPKYPQHTFDTRYWYNTLNQVIRDSTPDKGDTYFWYDQLGRLVLSQNAVQQHDIGFPERSKFTYFKYDDLGRTIETGKLKTYFFYGTPEYELGFIWNYPDFLNLLVDYYSQRLEVTQTFYDDTIPDISAGLSLYFPNAGDSPGQRNLRNRVASVTFEDVWDGVDTTFNYATHYSYDIAGNVKQLVQDIPELSPVGHRYKRVDYDYDLISGKVNKVYYQRDSVDQFIHHYVYDEDNRVEYVETSRDNLLWERDANYEYYLHGPLGRTELGERRVQGLDYAYTLQGWLKGMNASALSLSGTTFSTFTTRDMGRDGNSSNAGDLARNKIVCRDVAAFTLGYYFGDYRMISIASGDNFEMSYTSGGYFESAAPGLYNGNIRHAVYTVAKLNVKPTYEASVEGYAYKYDQLNRLVSMRTYNSGYSPSSNSWVSGTVSTMFREDAIYDPNGNILTYRRNGNLSSPALMDSLVYHYNGDNNRLTYIDDAQTNTSAYSGDLEDQSTGNYTYDALGNLTYEANGALPIYYGWTNAQKLGTVAKSDISLTFKYNPMQQRVAKYNANNSGAQQRTYYLRDAQGNVMATYQGWLSIRHGVLDWDSFKLAEQHIYGTSRIGIALLDIKIFPSAPPNPNASDSMHYVIFEGWKRYEITNHLGNVLTVITDRKRGKGSGSAIQWFVADVMASQQYYPFGMLMPGSADSTLRRQYSLNSYDYRYGFNGKEGDDEVKGDDNQQDYGMRVYDPRVGRWMSVDPLHQKYAYISPYNSFANNPIFYLDPDGKEIKPTYSIDKAGNLVIKIQVTGKVIDLSDKLFSSPAESFTKELNASASLFNGRASNLNIEIMGRKFTEAKVEFEFNFETVDKISDISESDHLFVLAPYRNLEHQLATGITSMTGGKVMHIDADFASGPLDDLYDNGLKTGLHEMFSHAMGAGHRNDKKTLTYKSDVTGRIGNEQLSDSDRGVIASFIVSGRINAGNTLLFGPLGETKYPNTNVTTIDQYTGRPINRTIGDVGFDIRSELITANKKQ